MRKQEAKMFGNSKVSEAVDLSEFEPSKAGIIDKFLKTKPHKRRTLHKSFPGFKAALFFKAVTEILNEYKVYATFGINRGELAAPSYSYLAVGRDKREELLIDGYRLVEKDSNRTVIFVEPGMRSMFLDIFYPEGKSDVAVNFLKSVEKYMSENNFYKGEKITPAGEFLPIPNLTFDDVKLPDEKKEAIRVGALEFFNKKEIYDKNNIPYKRGLILTGLPGTGKTLTGKILLAQSDCTFIWVTQSMVHYGEDVEYLYDMAKELAPCILFMEDLDDYLERSSAIGVIKTQMDGLTSVDGICTILCTNYPDRLPKALLDRPSRFDEVVVFSLPDEQLRYEILNKLAQPMNIENKNECLLAIAKKSDELTGAHLKEVLVYALLLSADAGRDIIKPEDLAKALTKVLKTREMVNGKIGLKSMEEIIKMVKGGNKEEALKVKVHTRHITTEIWECPYCHKEIGEKGIYYDSEAEKHYHRPCKNRGSIILPGEDREETRKTLLNKGEEAK